MSTKDSELCIGERFTSIKQIMSVAYPMAVMSKTQGDSTPHDNLALFDFWNLRNFMTGLFTDGYFEVAPYSNWDHNVIKLDSSGNTLYACPTPLCTYYSLLFAMARGSTTVVSRGGKVAFDNNAWHTDRFYGSNAFDAQLATRKVEDTPWTAVRIPFLSTYQYQPSGVDRPRPLNSAFRSRAFAREGDENIVSVCASDDAQLGLFICTWPLLVAQTSKILLKNYDYYVNTLDPSVAAYDEWDKLTNVPPPEEGTVVPEGTTPEQPLGPEL
jgi:hypothetical protein